MPRIRCHYIDCVFLDDGYCRSTTIELDSDIGCMTYSRTNVVGIDDQLEDEDQGLEEWEEIDDEELWLEDDEEF